MWRISRSRCGRMHLNEVWIDFDDINFQMHFSFYIYDNFTAFISMLGLIVFILITCCMRSTCVCAHNICMKNESLQ